MLGYQIDFQKVEPLSQTAALWAIRANYTRTRSIATQQRTSSAFDPDSLRPVPKIISP